jgi:hypothetical protein
MNIKEIRSIAMRNLINVMRFGLQAPRFQERIWVNPDLIEYRLSQLTRLDEFGTLYVKSGSVVPGDWDKKGYPFKDGPVFNDAINHWVNGVPWREIGVYERKLEKIKIKGMSDGCTNYEEVISRYDKLDEVFENVKKDGRLRTQEELSGKKFILAKGRGEIEVFIDRHGDPIHGCGGNHRLAIAKILRLQLIPAKIGVVHPEGIQYLKRYRLDKERLYGKEDRCTGFFETREYGVHKQRRRE